ncbi:MAG: hypothetical protein ACR2PH_18455, partial [Desulfobulbia bacterium]
SHNPLGEVNRESVVREIRMLRLTRRGLETGSKYRASLRPYLWERGGEIPLRHPTLSTKIRGSKNL